MSDERRCQLIRFVGLSVSDTNRTPDIERQEQRPLLPSLRGGRLGGGRATRLQGHRPGARRHRSPAGWAGPRREDRLRADRAKEDQRAVLMRTDMEPNGKIARSAGLTKQ